MKKTAQIRWPMMTAVGIGALILPVIALVVEPASAAPAKRTKSPPPTQAAPSEDAAESTAEGDQPLADKSALIRLNYVEATWEKVIKDFAEAAELTLVADYIPPKKYSRWDMKRYSKAEALRILNVELEKQNFQLQVKGRFLVMNRLRDLRHEYPPAVLKSGQVRPSDDESDDEVENAQNSNQHAVEQASHSTKAAAKSAKKERAAEISSRGKSIRLVSNQDDEDLDGVIGKNLQDDPTPVESAVPLKNLKASAAAGRIYRAFGTHAEKIDDGPQGLRGFRVRRPLSAKPGSEDDGDGPVHFSVGIDGNRNELIVSASATESKSILKLIKKIDNVPKTATGNGTSRLVRTQKDPAKLAAALQPELTRLAQATRKAGTPASRVNQADLDAEESNPEAPATGNMRGGNRRDDEGDETGAERALFGSLKGDVLVESVPELGILVIRGNEQDVAAVEKVIEEIERLSVQTAPRVKLAILRNIASETLAPLLTSVYDRLAGARNSAIQQSQVISVFAVARPNALLIVASNADLDAVIRLVDELDVPSGGEAEFMVYRLKHAVPSQVVDAVEAMYPPPTAQGGGAAANQNTTTGLVPRVRIIDDLRSNSVIVQARPRDLKEVAALIEKLDVVDTNSKQQIKIFSLTNAVADEVAFTVSNSIQNVLGPARATAAPTTGQPGAASNAGAQAASQGSGQGAAALREVKSTILEFLDEGGAEGRELRSGILSDIRMTADLRTNSIVVTAPPSSMPFVEKLIKQLDRPSATIAQIKVFQLKNADATNVQTLLERLFGIQRAGQQGGQGGQGGQQAGAVPGLLVEGSDDSSSMLIPLRFSVDIRTNSIIAIGGGGALDVVDAVVQRLDVSNIRQRENKVYFLKNAPAQNVATAVSQMLQSNQQILTNDAGILSPFEQIEREVIVVPEPTTNSLLISATPRYLKDVLALIRSLDRTPKQVLIQALICEVALTNTDEMGIEMGLQDSILFRRSPVPTPVTINNSVTQPNGNVTTTQQIISESATPGYLFSNQPLGNNTSAVTNPANIAGQAVTGFGTATTNGQLGYGGLVLQAGSENVNFLLRALAVRSRLDILSRPQVRVVNNQQSQIQVGQEIPRVNGFSSNGTAGVIVPTVQQRQIGIILQVTPRISPNDMVIMDVVARKDSLSNTQINLGVSAGGQQVTSPVVNTTNAVTTVAIPSGNTVILGGMITKNDLVEERKVPLLGDIPLIGRAFRYDLKQMTRTELLIFLTPRVIHDEEEAELFKQIETERINFIESEAERLHGPLYGVPAPSTNPNNPVDDLYPLGTEPADSGSTPKLPSSANPGTNPPAPPPAGLPGTKSTKRIQEPRPLRGVEPDDGTAEAAHLQMDDDDDSLETISFQRPELKESIRSQEVLAKTKTAGGKQSNDSRSAKKARRKIKNPDDDQ